MSSLQASKADNFYFPPEWEPKHGSISKFQGSKGKNQYEQFGIIRFELPYHCWCLKCEAHIGKGTRYNAKKEKAGKYFSTQIWEFHTKCHLCDHRFIIRTDPKNTDYEFVEGLRKKDTLTEADALESCTQVIDDDLTVKKINTDAFAMLEHRESSIKKVQTEKQQLHQLQQMCTHRSYNDFELNSELRRKMRGTKRKLAHEEKESREKGLGIKLLPHSDADIKGAKLVHFKTSAFQENEKKRFAAITSSSIFGPSPSLTSQKLVELQITKKRMKLGFRSIRVLGKNETSSSNTKISISKRNISK